jgi:hypothetical protein
MQEISKFFDRIRNIALQELHKRESISSALSKSLNIKLNPQDFEYNNCVITVKGSGVLKSEIFLKKKNIIDILAKKGFRVIDIK